jgi:hypothetical protein
MQLANATTIEGVQEYSNFRMGFVSSAVVEASDVAQKKHANLVLKNAKVFKERVQYPAAKVIGHGNPRDKFKETVNGCPYR